MKRVLILLAVLPLYFCSPSTTGNNDDDRDEQGLYGTLVVEGGDTAESAKVTLFSYDPSEVLSKGLYSFTDSTGTDNHGKYVFTGLETGTYLLQGRWEDAEGEVYAVYRSGLEFDSLLDAGTDTLKMVGHMQLRILYNDEPIPGADCFIGGTMLQAVSDDSGKCLLSDIPHGNYSVQFFSSREDTGGTINVSVKAGKTSGFEIRLSGPDTTGPGEGDTLSNPFPSDKATDVDLSIALAWTGIEADSGIIVSYDVYLDTAADPEVLITSGRSLPFVSVSRLKDDQKYYWQVIARIGSGTVKGPVWSFTTKESPEGNTRPEIPSNPSPADGAYDQDVFNLALSWKGGDADSSDRVLYDLYLSVENPPVTKVATGLSETGHRISSLGNGTMYYWRVVASDGMATEEGPVWSFTTSEVSSQNTRPYVPSDPAPADNAEQVDLSVQLSWKGGDPDTGDQVRYSLFFGNSTPPPELASGLSSSSYQVSGLQENTIYYWKVVSYDGQATSIGATWRFTTRDGHLVNTKPYTPHSPVPENGAYDQDLKVTLQWKGGDPDENDIVTYSLFADTVNPPEQIKAWELKTTSYALACSLSNTKWYWCVAASDGEYTVKGPVWHFTTMPVVLAPSIEIQPADQSVLEGSTATFSVVASGSEPLDYQWRRDGTPITGAVDAAYTTPEVASADNGMQFDVVVSNRAGSMTSDPALLTVTKIVVAPSVTQHPESQTVSERERAIFFIEASGTAPLTYRWEKDGEALSGEKNPYLILQDVQVADAGTYRCVVSNTAGSDASNEATLTVHILPPSITGHPASQTVTEGDPVSFSVDASGTDLSYQWQKNGSDILNATGPDHTISSAAMSDAGTYRCIVSNEGGEATSDWAVLTVSENIVPPSVVSQPADLIVEEGQTALFRVEASGSVPLSYQWQKEGVDISGATSASLSISGVQVSDSGSYRCVVSNAAGSDISNEALLTVTIAAPVVTGHPASQTVTEGDPVSFSVSAQGTDLSYQWRKDGADITGATDTVFSIAHTGPEDMGEYRCVVTNVGGSDVSNPATLTVRLLPRVTTHPVSQTVYEGQSVVFSVTAAGEPPLEYQWRRNGSFIMGANEPEYSIESAILALDKSRYDVIVSNQYSRDTSDAAVLTVKQLPSITAHPVSKTVSEGEPASFRVSAEGDAPLSYQWQKSGFDIGSWRNIEGATADGYAVDTAMLSDQGQYRCIVSNPGGADTSNAAVLAVNVAVPVITQQPESQTVIEGDLVTFAVAAVWSGLEYQWQRTGNQGGELWTDIQGANDSEYFISGAKLTHSGQYRCIVSNTAGRDTSNTATLTVNMAPPKITTHPVSQTVNERDSVVFTVGASGSGLHYQWRRNGVNITSATQYRYKIPAAQMSDDGAAFDVLVSNQGGEVLSNTAVLTVILQPPHIARQPQDVTVPVGQSATFRLIAESGAHLSYQWYRNELPIKEAVSDQYTTPPVDMSYNGNVFQVVVKNEAGEVLSDPAVLTVQSIIIPPSP